MLTISHLELPLQPALERRARLQQLQAHVDAGAAEILLHDGQMALEPLLAVDEREAGLLAAVVDQDVVGVGAREQQARKRHCAASPQRALVCDASGRR